jgi:hypothetical protein
MMNKFKSILLLYTKQGYLKISLNYIGHGSLRSLCMVRKAHSRDMREE